MSEAMRKDKLKCSNGFLRWPVATIVMAAQPLLFIKMFH
jgi:hypothetical protein